MKSVGIPLQFACFSCRKSFKRPQFSPAQNRFMTENQLAGQAREVESFKATREYKCPDCGGQTHFMGQDFKAPRKGDLKGWAAAQDFIESGRLYYRGASRDG